MLREPSPKEKREIYRQPLLHVSLLSIVFFPPLNVWCPSLETCSCSPQPGRQELCPHHYDGFNARKMMKFHLFISLSGLLRSSVSGVCNGCSTASQQYHLCQLLPQCLCVSINQCFSWAFLICGECVYTCSNSGMWHPVRMLATFQDLLTALQKGSKIGFVSTSSSQLNSAEMYEGRRRKDRAPATLI